MSELKRFNGFKAVSSVTREQLPVGGYVAKVLGAKLQDTQYGQRLVFQVEIIEGEYKDFFRRDYESQKGGMYEPKYKGVYSINYPTGDGSERDSWNINRFNRTMGALEESNINYHWDWKLTNIKDKQVGILVRESEYNDNKFTEIGAFISAESIRSGKYRNLKPRIPAKGVETASSLSQSSLSDYTPIADEEIPF